MQRVRYLHFLSWDEIKALIDEAKERGEKEVWLPENNGYKDGNILLGLEVRIIPDKIIYDEPRV